MKIINLCFIYINIQSYKYKSLCILHVNLNGKQMMKVTMNQTDLFIYDKENQNNWNKIM